MQIWSASSTLVFPVLFLADQNGDPIEVYGEALNPAEVVNLERLQNHVVTRWLKARIVTSRERAIKMGQASFQRTPRSFRGRAGMAHEQEGKLTRLHPQVWGGARYRTK